MVRTKMVVVLCVLVAGIGLSVPMLAADGVSGTLGVDATFLPGFGSTIWAHIVYDVDSWSFGNRVDITVFPGFTASWKGSVSYTFGPADIGASLQVDVYPFSLSELDVHAGVALFDVVEGSFELSGDARFTSEILPAFDSTLSLEIDASYSIVSLEAIFSLDVPGFDPSVWLWGQLRVLDLQLEDGTLTADLGASATVLPAGSPGAWFDVTLSLGSVTVSSETDFVFGPFGLNQQRFDVSMVWDHVSVTVWLRFAGDGELSAGVGATYGFP